MSSKRAPAWYWVRLELGVGIVLVLVVALLLLSATPLTDEAIQVGPFLLWGRFAVPLVALGPAVVGLIWMIRIVRGPRDEPPSWRYRDH